MFYLDSDKREIKGWIKDGDNKLREDIKNGNNEMKRVYDKFNDKIEKIVEQQQISDAQFQNQVQAQIDSIKDDTYNLKQNVLSASAEVSDLKDGVDRFQNQIQAQIDTLKDDTYNLKQNVLSASAGVADLKDGVDRFQNQIQAQIDTLKDDTYNLKQNQMSSAEVVKLKNELAELKKNVDSAKTPAPLIEISSLKKEFGILKTEVAALQTPALPQEVEGLKKAVIYLQQILNALKTSSSTEIVALKNEVAELKKELAAQKIPDSSAEVLALKNEVAELKKEVAELKKELKTSEPPPPTEIREEDFFLPAQEEVFIPNSREKIPAKIKSVLSVGEIEKYLNPTQSESSKKFQKLLAVHVKDAKKFIDKLKTKNLDDEELSEFVTSGYFKLFYSVIFDNLLVAIRRGSKSSGEYYSGLLVKVNEYLTRCGIYTVNTLSGKKAEDVDYENMKPQILKTNDKNLTEHINAIERLPYRINYLDEFGEQKYFQYAGIMNLYKAV